MTNLGPSLEDLLSPQQASDDDTATGKLQDKMEEIRIKEKE